MLGYDAAGRSQIERAKSSTWEMPVSPDERPASRATRSTSEDSSRPSEVQTVSEEAGAGAAEDGASADDVAKGGAGEEPGEAKRLDLREGNGPSVRSRAAPELVRVRVWMRVGLGLTISSCEVPRVRPLPWMDIVQMTSRLLKIITNACARHRARRASAAPAEHRAQRGESWQGERAV